jgi:hypothetical protein
MFYLLRDCLETIHCMIRSLNCLLHLKNRFIDSGLYMSSPSSTLGTCLWFPTEGRLCGQPLVCRDLVISWVSKHRLRLESQRSLYECNFSWSGSVDLFLVKYVPSGQFFTYWLSFFLISARCKLRPCLDTSSFFNKNWSLQETRTHFSVITDECSSIIEEYDEYSSVNRRNNRRI